MAAMNQWGQPTSDGLPPKSIRNLIASNGLQLESDGLQPNSVGLLPNSKLFQAEVLNM